MRVLVTGGAGYIGSHVVLALSEAGHEAWVFDDLSTGHRDAVLNGRLILGSLLDQASMRWPESIDAVIHLAGRSNIQGSMEDPATHYRGNVVTTLNLLNEMRAHDVPYLIFSSSCSVYGEPLLIPIDEDHPKSPVSPYGETKLVIENMLRHFDRAYGIRSVSLRYFNAAGADPEGRAGERHDPEMHLVPRLLGAALDPSKVVTLYGQDSIRDYVHVADIADAHLKALEWLTKDLGSEAFNLGTGQGHSIAEVVDQVRAITDRPIRTVIGEPRPGDPKSLIANADKARKWLGWELRHSSLRTIIETAWAWHSRMAEVAP